MSLASVPLQQVTRLTPLPDVCACIEATAQPVAPRQLETAAAAGRVLAADVAVSERVPMTAIALRDGWAVRSDLVADANPYAPAMLTPAPTWVDAGEPLPPDADAVLAFDAVTASGQAMEAVGSAALGEGVLGAGSEALPGQPLRRAGERLRQIDVAALRAAGVAQVQAREPSLSVYVANGSIGVADDVVAPLVARGVEAGGGVVRVQRAADRNGRHLLEILRADDADAVVVIGGTGSGRRDTSISALADAGRVIVHGVGIRPGETAAFGTVGSRPVLVLPGRLDAALAAWLLIGRRLLACLTGSRETEPAMKVTLSRKVVSTIGLAEVVPVGSSEGGVAPLASGCLPLQALTQSVGWIFVPPESEGFPVGATVELRPFP